MFGIWCCQHHMRRRWDSAISNQLEVLPNDRVPAVNTAAAAAEYFSFPL
jgi:hypothetical protein